MDPLGAKRGREVLTLNLHRYSGVDEEEIKKMLGVFLEFFFFGGEFHSFFNFFKRGLLKNSLIEPWSRTISSCIRNLGTNQRMFC